MDVEKEEETWRPWGHGRRAIRPDLEGGTLSFEGAPGDTRRVVFTAAAERRLERRPFLRDRVAAVLAAPDSVEETPDGATRYVKCYDRRRISIKVRQDRRRRDLLLVVAVEQGRA